MEKTKIAVVDDQVLFRKGLVSILENRFGIEVLIEAGGGKEFIEKLNTAAHLPGIVLLDLEMPDMDGKKVIEYLKEHYPQVKIIILSVHYNNDLVAHFIEMGTNSYLPKNTEPEELEMAIASVVKNDFYFNDNTLHALRKAIASKGKNKNTVLVGSLLLTMREIEVLELICREFNTAEIAEKLFISPRTVEGHRVNLLTKTNARNTAGLVLFAVKSNIINTYNSPV